jgi:hypothetical protein
VEKMAKKNNSNNNNNGRYNEPTFWQYWKRTILEDMDELRNHIIDCRMEQARIALEMEEIQLRLDQIQKIMENDYIIELRDFTVEKEEGDEK